MHEVAAGRVSPYRCSVTTALPVSSPRPRAATGSPARGRIPFVGIFVAWTAWGLWSAQQSVLLATPTARTVTSRAETFALSLTMAWLWLMLTPVVMVITRHARDRVSSRAARVALALATFAVAHAIDAAVYSIASASIAHVTRPFPSLLLSLLAFNAIICTAIVAVTLALDSHQALRDRDVRDAQLDAQLALAQFHALRAQLQPHFLFNTLNAISALMHTDVGRADRMLARVSELLRIAIDTAAAPELPLAQEVDFVNRYLELERMRFGDRLAVAVDVPSELQDALVPSMLLQPLVENAVRHGVAPYARPGRVELLASRAGDRLSIVVRDSGNGLAHGRATDGVGLGTTRARLEKLYGASQELTLVNVPGGFETRVSLPFRRASDTGVLSARHD